MNLITKMKNLTVGSLSTLQKLEKRMLLLNEIDIMKFRIFSFFVLLTVELHSLLLLTPIQYFRHFTEWGLTVSFLTFILLIVKSIVDRAKTKIRQQDLFYKVPKEEEQISSKFDKFCLIVLEIAFSAEVCITILFWGVLVPAGLHQGLYSLQHDLPKFSLAIMPYWGEVHIFPLVLLTIEIAVNKMKFTRVHILFSILLNCIFIPVDIILYFIRGLPSYFIGRWDNLITPILGVMTVLTAFIAFYFGLWICEVKSRKRKRLVSRKRSRVLFLYKKSM